MFKPFLIPFTFLLVSFAHAGSLANDTWSSSRCGERPSVAALDLRNPDAFNRSVEPVNVYREKSAVYLDCLIAEGNADIALVTTTVKSEQQAVREVNEKIRADLEQAKSKFKN